MAIIPYGKQSISEEDIEAVVKVLKSDFLTQGPVVPEFENAISEYCDVKYSVASSNATCALHLACLALDIGPGDLVWTSAVTFVASANCARYCGANVDFVDIDPDTFNMSVAALQEKLEAAERNGLMPKAIIPVHLSGHSCEMKAISELAKKYEVKIIEDASHAIGGKYLNRPIGSCDYSDISVFSFHPVKIITSAEGGLCTTNDAELAATMNLYRTHGITRDPNLMTKRKEGPWYYQQLKLGFNYRMSELHAALGLSQLSRLDEFVLARNELAGRYFEDLDSLPIKFQKAISSAYSAFHLLSIRITSINSLKEKEEIFNQLREQEIGVNVHYIPPHTQPYYSALGFKETDFPESIAYYKQAFSLPLFPSLTSEQFARVKSALTVALKG